MLVLLPLHPGFLFSRLRWFRVLAVGPRGVFSTFFCEGLDSGAYSRVYHVACEKGGKHAEDRGGGRAQRPER